MLSADSENSEAPSQEPRSCVGTWIVMVVERAMSCVEVRAAYAMTNLGRRILQAVEGLGKMEREKSSRVKEPIRSSCGGLPISLDMNFLGPVKPSLQSDAARFRPGFANFSRAVRNTA